MFCEFCGISVHQQCYGIDDIPEGDWYCISCTIMGKNRSWNLKCALCPWFGGALRPTNISSWDPTFIKYQTTIIEPDKIIEEVKPSKK